MDTQISEKTDLEQGDRVGIILREHTVLGPSWNYIVTPGKEGNFKNATLIGKEYKFNDEYRTNYYVYTIELDDGTQMVWDASRTAAPFYFRVDGPLTSEELALQDAVVSSSSLSAEAPPPKKGAKKSAPPISDSLARAMAISNSFLGNSNSNKPQTIEVAPPVVEVTPSGRPKRGTQKKEETLPTMGITMGTPASDRPRRTGRQKEGGKRKTRRNKKSKKSRRNKKSKKSRR